MTAKRRVLFAWVLDDKKAIEDMESIGEILSLALDQG